MENSNICPVCGCEMNYKEVMDSGYSTCTNKDCNEVHCGK